MCWEMLSNFFSLLWLRGWKLSLLGEILRMLDFIASKCLRVVRLWCEGVMYFSVVPVVGFKIWNCSKYKLLKSFLPHSCSKYSKSQSNWNMSSTWPNSIQREKDYFFRSQKYNSYPRRSITLCDLPLIDSSLCKLKLTSVLSPNACSHGINSKRWGCLIETVQEVV